MNKKELLKLITNAKNKSLKELDLSNSKLTELPEEIGELVSLEKLDLSHNKLKKLPSSIGKLKNLKYLDVSYNNLLKLPEEIVNIGEMDYLNLSYNYKLGFDKIISDKKEYLNSKLKTKKFDDFFYSNRFKPKNLILVYC